MKRADFFRAALLVLLIEGGGEATAQSPSASPQGDGDSATRTEYRYYSDGVEVPLFLQEDRFAARHAGADSETAAAELAAELSPGWARTVALAPDLSLFARPNASAPPRLQLAPSAGRAKVRELLPELAQKFEDWFFMPVFRASGKAELLMTDEVIVHFARKIDESEAISLLALEEAWSRQYPRSYRSTQRFVVEAGGAETGFEALELADRLWQLPEVVVVMPNFHVLGIQSSSECVPFSDTADAEPSLISSWGLGGGYGSQAMSVWPECGGGTGSFGDIPLVTVGVMGVGVELDHPDLDRTGGGVPGITHDPASTFTDGGVEDECDNHETAVAGVIAMRDNGDGSLGAAPKVELYSSRIHNTAPLGSGCQTNGVTSLIDDGIDWLALDQQGPQARVINYSYNWGTQNGDANQAFLDAADAGVVVVVSAGNGNVEVPVWPGGNANVLTVGAIGSTGNRWFSSASFASNFGPSLDLVAPGGAIFTTDRDGDDGYGSDLYTTQSGTSYAAPHVAGAAALLIAEEASLTFDDVRDLLCAGARDPADTDGRFDGTTFEDGWGCGALDAEYSMWLMLNGGREGIVFLDNFEEGDTDRWSESEP